MFNKLTTQFDQLSFFLGIIAASLFWWVISRIKFEFPKVAQFFRQRIEAFRNKYFAGMDAYIRTEMYKYTQSIHLARSLFPLDKIIIPPRLLANSFLSEKPDFPVPDSIAKQVIPYTPDLPDLASVYPYPVISLAEALQKKANIAIMGRPGTGKTTALVHLTSLIAKKDPVVSVLSQLVPLYFHILEIEENGDQSPFDHLVKSIAASIPSIAEPSFRRFLVDSASSGNIILLIDGLDELFPDDLKKKVAFLERLMRDFPKLRYVVTADPENLDRLVNLGFIPMTLAIWNFHQRADFLKNWESLWNARAFNFTKRGANSINLDCSVIINWIQNENVLFTPLEWTLITWVALAGGLKYFSIASSLEGFVDLVRENSIPRNALYHIANDLMNRKKSWFEYEQIEKSFAHFRPNYGNDTNNRQPDLKTNNLLRKSGPKDKRISSRERAIDSLFENGLFLEHRNGLITFQNPLFAAYLASFTSPVEIFHEPNLLQACMGRETLPFMAANNRADDLLEEITSKRDASPFISRLMLAASCASQTNKKSNWRTKTFFELSNSLINETLPLCIRTRSLIALLNSNDSTIFVLFKQLIASSSPSTRQLVALGCGALRENSLFEDLSGLLNDENTGVRNAACLALSISNTYSANRKIQEILIQGDEGQKQAAAESLIGNPKGNEIIIKLLESEDLLTRRAAIIALSNKREQWAEKVIEKVAIEDKQWVVRNAASQILESLHHPNPEIPAPLVKASEAPWLIKFAAKQGAGLKPDEDAGDILLLALKEGNPEEKLSSLQYLIKQPDEEVVREIIHLLETKNENLFEAALLALWFVSVNGANLLKY